MIKLDYTIESPEERRDLVEKIIAENPNLSSSYLEVLADYMILCMEKKERKEKKVLTDNHMMTVNKRERSFEGMAAQMENGEDGIYSLMSDDRNMIFQPKISITKKDLESIPELKQLREAIDQWEGALKRAAGTKEAYIIKRALIEMRKDQYIIKQAYQRPIVPCRLTHSSKPIIPLDDDSYLDGQDVHIQGISLMEPKVISAILCNYVKLKEGSYADFKGDMWYFIQSFEDVCGRALEEFPIYQRILWLKVEKRQNTEIQSILKDEFDTTYSIEYISNLWRNKIPRLIAETALEDFLTWQYKLNNYPMKKCSKCGQIKPAHNQFFSKNKTSKDFYYSICKKCRNKKRG